MRYDPGHKCPDSAGTRRDTGHSTSPYFYVSKNRGGVGTCPVNVPPVMSRLACPVCLEDGDE